MKKAHVVHITSVHPAMDTRIFIKECRTLAKAGYQVSLVVLGAKSEVRDGVHIIGVPFQGGRIRRFFKGKRDVLKQAVLLKGQICHLHDPELLTISSRLMRAGYKVVYDAHEDLPRQIEHKHYIPAAFKKGVAWIVEKLENFYASKLSAIVTVTPNIVKRFNGINDTVVEVCNYPDFDDIHLVKSSWTERRICYVGGITEARGIRELLNALTLIDAQLVLAGAFSPMALLEELSQHPAWNKVDYRGFLNREEVNQVLAECTIGLVTLQPHPGYQTAYPVKMFEYMAAGLPIVATNIPLWTEILKQHGAGVTVDINDPIQYQKAIEDILNDTEEAKAMGLRGQEAARLYFNWKNEGQKLLNLYDLILSR